MDSNYLLGNKYRIRRYFLFGLTGLLAFFFLRFFVLPYLANTPLLNPTEIAVVTIDNIIVAIIVVLSTTAFILFITPPSTRKPEVSVVESGNLKYALEEELKDTKEFWYRGHTARWSRSVTFSKLAKSARKDKRTIRIFLIILDPNSDAVCESYANFQNKFGQSKNNIEPLKHEIRLELLATILSAYAWANKEPLLKISIGLWDKLSLFRVDLSDSAAIITKPDIDEPALSFPAGTRFFMSFREDLQVSYSQSRVLPEKKSNIRFGNLSPKNLKQFFANIGIRCNDINDNSLRKIIEMSEKPETPYK